MNSANAALWRQFEGQSIDNTYRLNRLIGVGGFAGVFETDHVVEGRMLRRVAVKLIVADTESMQRQLDELVAATMLHHPHLLGCFHAASSVLGPSKLLYLVMEMAQDTLQSRLATGLTLPEITALTEQVASALVYLHQKKLRVHRDLKPANVLLVEGDWKLSDFGTIRPSQGSASSHTAAVMGTLPYMPPESFYGTVSTSWDTWSLGVLLLETLTGQRPYTEITDGELIAAIMQKSPTIPEGLPAPFDQIVRGCLTKNHRERWSAQRVLDELERPATAAPQAVAPPPEIGRPAGVTEQQRQDAELQHWLREMRSRAAQATASRDLDGALKIWTEVWRVNPGDDMAKRAIASIQERQREERSGARISRTPPPAPPTPPTPTPRTPTPPTPPKRRRRWMWLLAPVAVAFVAVGVWALVNQRSSSPGVGPRPGTQEKTWVNPKDGLTYVRIPAGKFKMGCSDGDTECFPDESPAHEVTLTKGFWIGQTEVTQAAYQRVKGAASNPSHWKGATLPVENISWDDAQAYCQAVGMRLPTEAEWEYAARGGNSSPRYGPLDKIAWYLPNSMGKTHPVAQKQPNGYGLYDTLGNVWEWVSDYYDAGYYGSNASRDPQNGSLNKGRARRGGSWFVFGRNARVSTRGWFVPISPHYTIGMRCARND